MPKYSSLEENYKAVISKAIETCTFCGTCVDNCPIFPLTPIKDEEIMQKVVDFLKGGAFSEDVYMKAYSCAGCGYCSDCCPQGLDPLLIHEALKVELIKRGLKPPEAFNFVTPGQKFNIFGILSALQTKPPERRWLMRMPSQPERTENVVFLGCFTPALPHYIFALLDILEGMGVDFITLAGGELCCGTTLCPGAGKAKEAEEKARELLTSIKAFSPKRLILTCTGCFRQITESLPSFLELDFEVKYYTQFLSENLEKIKFTEPLDKTVTLHGSCMGRRTNISDSARKILEAIPGLTLVENRNAEKQALCCGGVANTSYPQMAQKLGQTLAEEIIKTKADYIVTTCPFCRLTFYPYARQYSFNVKDITTLINVSMGGREYEDKLDKYWRCDSVEELIKKSREYFEANGYTVEEMRKILPLLFPVSVP
jgi:Fe-S oxidoreductase